MTCLRCNWDDDARLAEIRERIVASERDGWRSGQHDTIAFLLRLLDEARAERDHHQEGHAQAVDLLDKTIQKRDALAAKLAKTSVLIKDVRDNGLIHWRPSTSEGAVSKALMFNRIAEILSALDDIGGQAK